MLRSNLERSSERRAALGRYYAEHVLSDDCRFVCQHAQVCRASVQRARGPRDFWEGQLSYVGRRYDLEEAGAPLRILVIAMETGHAPPHVTMEERRAQIDKSASAGFARRNAHMKGTTSALRALLGRAPGEDRSGERLPGGGHLFDGYAMVNLRLCSANAQGTTESRATTKMSANCSEHLAAAIRILEPTVCVIQGVRLRRWIEPLLSDRRRQSETLDISHVGDVRSMFAWFTHPSAENLDQTWGRLTSAPYLYETVVPTLRRARALADADWEAGPAPEPRPSSVQSLSALATDDLIAARYSEDGPDHRFLAPPRLVPQLPD